MYLACWIGTPTLQPLLGAQVRDTRTSKSTFDAELLPGRPDGFDSFVYWGWALEVGRIGCHLAHEPRDALDLFRSGCVCALVRCPDVGILKTGIAYLYQSGPHPPLLG